MKVILPNSVTFDIPFNDNGYIRLSIDLVTNNYCYNKEELSQAITKAVAKYLLLLEK